MEKKERKKEISRLAGSIKRAEKKSYISWLLFCFKVVDKGTAGMSTRRPGVKKKRKRLRLEFYITPLESPFFVSN